MVSCVVQQCKALIFSQNSYQTLCNPPCHQETCCLKALSFQALMSLLLSAGNQNMKNWKNWRKAIFSSLWGDWLFWECSGILCFLCCNPNFMNVRNSGCTSAAIPAPLSVSHHHSLLVNAVQSASLQAINSGSDCLPYPPLSCWHRRPHRSATSSSGLVHLVPLLPGGEQYLNVFERCRLLSSTDLLHLSAVQVDFDYSWTQF